MNNVYNNLVDYAYEKIEFCDNIYQKSGNQMGYVGVLWGQREFKVAIHPQEEHNFQAAIDAIFEYKKNKKDSKIDEGYYSALKEMIFLFATKKQLNDLINILLYQERLQKENPRVLDLDIKSLYVEFEASIKEKYDYLKSHIDNFDEWLEEQNEYLETKNHKINIPKSS